MKQRRILCSWAEDESAPTAFCLYYSPSLWATELLGPCCTYLIDGGQDQAQHEQVLGILGVCVDTLQVTSLRRLPANNLPALGPCDIKCLWCFVPVSLLRGFHCSLVWRLWGTRKHWHRRLPQCACTLLLRGLLAVVYHIEVSCTLSEVRPAQG